jgi:hypothetical protein
MIQNTNGPFKTQDEAAMAALLNANPQSIKDNAEYGGLIYLGADGFYYYTCPIKCDGDTVEPKDAPAPPGGSVVGDYHTHGDYSIKDPITAKPVATGDPARDDYDSDNFSVGDKQGIAMEGKGIPAYAGYLGTPSGTFRKYDPATKCDTMI